MTATCDDTELIFYVNGIRVVEKNVDPETTLLQYLRQKLSLTGTKLGCAEGGCGACTVMVSRYDRQQNKILHLSVNACLAPVVSMHGQAVTTVEGIGSTKTRLHPVQDRLAKAHGSQCGFCTPGIVMSMYTLLRNNPQPSLEEIESSFEGNLCRCTGYRPILAGFKTFSKEFQCGMGENCCRNKKKGQQNGLSQESSSSTTEPLKASQLEAFDPTQEPIFPSQLQLSDRYDSSTLEFCGERVTWIRPVTLEHLLKLKAEHPNARLIIGNSEIGVEVKFKNMVYPVMLSVTHIPELLQVEHCQTGIKFGASVTLTRLDQELKDTIKRLPAERTRVFAAIVEMLRWFAGHQVRNVAAIGGNIMTASPISDLNPLFLSAGCVLELASTEGRRTVKMDSTFFTGYRRTVVKPEEVLVSVHIPFTRKNEYFCGYKQAQRREDDISIVNAGCRVLFEDNSKVVQELALSFGGMAPTTKMATKAMQAAVGKEWNDELLAEVCQALREELPLPPGVPGGMESYRKTLTLSFFFKFYLTTLQQLNTSSVSVEGSPVPASHLSATTPYQRGPSQGIQVYEEVQPGQKEVDSVGRSITHTSAAKQAAGEARYLDDIPKSTGELYLGLVLSSKAHANILGVDPTDALAMPGVVSYVDHKDVPGSNTYGLGGFDVIFAADKVTCVGQVIGAVLADTQFHAQLAAKAVKVQYEELKPIITIEEAIAAESFYDPIRTIKKGDLEKGFAESDHILEGQFRQGGQEHFYLETNACLVIPQGEDGEMEIIGSIQAPNHAQMAAAEALNVPANRITCRVKRLGGGFGGKETRFTVLELPAVVAAHKTGRPVRCMLDRDEDMLISGTRHPFLGKYKVGFSKEGKFLALDMKLYCNAGNSLDLSMAVMERAQFHTDNCYRIPNLAVTGYVCKTNIASNTAFRGFGGPQGMIIAESWVNDVAEQLGISQQQVRELNMYKEGELTHFNQALTNCNFGRCWEECLTQSDYHNTVASINTFNQENRWRKRGISIIPTKFGIAFTATFLNQGGSLVHIYTDGSVLITHGGTEMGQGLHTKVIQVASRALNIPISKIHISETATNLVPNASPTAASMGSDLYGMAVLKACQTLMERLEPFITAKPKGSWEEWVSAAYMDRVSLSTTGFYKVPDLGYNFDTNSGQVFDYFTYGAACSVVEIDCLTGDHSVLRTDIVMDVGTSINPSIDIGQIEGAFTQGYGLFTLESQKVSPGGVLLNRGPGAYKIPGFGDIPLEFNVSLLKGVSNPRAVYSSKAVGEPPLFLAASVFFAIKDAVTAARSDCGISGLFPFNSPATSEKIRMACVDQFTKQFPEAEPGSYTPWTVDL